MHRKISVFILSTLIFISSCASPQYMMVGDDIERIRPYGLLNEKNVKRDDIRYDVSPGSVILGIMLYPTIWVPVWMFGWKLYKPVSVNENYPISK